MLLDVVYNHVGPSDLDLWQFDGWARTAWAASTSITIGVPTRHGATRGRTTVARKYAKYRDNALMWLHDYHVDGLRFDATAYIRNVKGNDNPGDDLPEGWNLLRWINDEINARRGRSRSPRTCATTRRSRRQPATAGPASMPKWDAGFVHPFARH